MDKNQKRKKTEKNKNEYTKCVKKNCAVNNTHKIEYTPAKPPKAIYFFVVFFLFLILYFRLTSFFLPFLVYLFVVHSSQSWFLFYFNSNSFYLMCCLFNAWWLYDVDFRRYRVVNTAQNSIFHMCDNVTIMVSKVMLEMFLIIE